MLPVKIIFALGFFDGVHLGHQVLLEACRHLAMRKGCATGAVTFASHPDALVTGKTPLLLNTAEERERTLLGYGAFHIHVLPFDKTLMNMPWQDFLEMLLEKGYHVVNVDCTILAQAPKLAPFIPQMRDNLARLMGILPDQVNVKATTEEKLGFTGTEEGMAAHAVCLIEKNKE